MSEIELIAQYGAVAVIFLFSIREFFAWMKSKENNKKGGNGNGGTTHPLCREIIELSALFKSHNDAQAEQLSTIHNGLNTNAGAIDRITKALADNTNAITRLETIINERIPKN